MQGLTALQNFLKVSAFSDVVTSVNELDSLFLQQQQQQQQSPYNFLDSFVSYLTTDCRLSPNTVSLYVAAVKGYLEHCDVEINPTKFKNKVTMPKTIEKTKLL